jgi:hypothetical protein
MSTPKKFTKSTSNPNENTKKPPLTKGQEPNAKETGPSMFPSTPFQKFLISHMHKKTEPSDTITNTRISGGSYTIPETEYAHFLNLYYQHVFVENNHEYLTERQYKDKGPIAIDFDFQFAKDVKKRQYTEEHIMEILNAYLEVLGSVYQLVNPNDDGDDDDEDECDDDESDGDERDEKSQVSSLSEDEEATAVLGMQKPESAKPKRKRNLPTVFEIYVFEKPNVNTMFWWWEQVWLALHALPRWPNSVTTYPLFVIRIPPAGLTLSRPKAVSMPPRITATMATRSSVCSPTLSRVAITGPAKPTSIDWPKLAEISLTSAWRKVCHSPGNMAANSTIEALAARRSPAPFTAVAKLGNSCYWEPMPR